MNELIKICSKCVSDETLPDIEFDENGVCNYCKQFESIAADSPNDERGAKIIERLFEEIKKNKRKGKYDVVVGVSGGVDSTYLVHYAVKNGLRVLAVNFDNGWHSEIAVSNIKKCLDKLGVDLITYVVDYDEMKDLLLSYMKAGIPWADTPTDLALLATLYKAAAQNKVKTIFVGNNFRTEGKQPNSWTHGDTRQLRYIQKKFGTQKIKSFPMLSPFKLLYFGIAKRIKMVRPFNYLVYSKKAARELLEHEYGWKDYGGHHHESTFTKFAIAYWLPKKFGIEKRKVTFSAQIRCGLMDREEALSLLTKPPYDPALMEEDKNYVIKKLGINTEEFDRIWNSPNKSIFDYPSYLQLYYRYQKLANSIFRFILPFKPMMGYDLKNQ